MANETNHTAIWVVVVGIILAVILIGGFMMINGKVNDTNAKVDSAQTAANAAKASADSAKATVNDAVSQIQTAVSSQSSNGVVLSGVGAGSVVDEENSRLLQGVYPSQSSQLESDCRAGLWNEYGTYFTYSKVLVQIRHLIETQKGEPIKNLVIVNWNNYNDYNFDVMNLGLSDQANRAAQITDTIKVRYQLEDGVVSDVYNKNVFATAQCSQWDKRNNVFDSLTLDLHL